MNPKQEEPQTWPAPPVASIVTGATKRIMLLVCWSRASAPRQCGTPLMQSVIKSVARWCSKKVMFGCDLAALSKARSISRPANEYR